MALAAALLLLAGVAPGSARPVLVCRITHAPMPAPAPAAQGGSCCPGETPRSAPAQSLSETGCCEWQASRDNPRLPTGLVTLGAAIVPTAIPALAVTPTSVSRCAPPTMFVRTALRGSAGPRAPPLFS